MAWLWWLLAPIAVTAAGGLVLTWRDHSEARTRTRDPMAAHQELLRALAECSVPSGTGKATPSPGR